MSQVRPLPDNFCHPLLKSTLVERPAGRLVVFLFVASRCQLAAKEKSPTGLTSRLSYTQNCLPGSLELSRYLGNRGTGVQPL